MIHKKQSPELAKIFQKQVDDKVAAKRQDFQERIEKSPLKAAGMFFWEIEQRHNKVKGHMGEKLLSFLANSLSDDWIMFTNALIPVDNEKLTEIDLILIGVKGIFLMEVKTWTGSFSCYRDKWKRRQGSQWVPLEDSPSQQSLYHQKIFYKWMNQKDFILPQNDVVSPVVFPIAKWIGVKECSVPVIHGVSGVQQFIQEREVNLNFEQVLKISEIIEEIKFSLTQKSPIPKPILRQPS